MSGGPRIVVIGGGIAGLTVAYRLRQHPDAGEVTLLEAGDHAGGHVGTLHEDGFTVEAGPNGFLHRVREPEPMALVDELGLSEALIEARPAAKRRYVLHRRKLRPVPASPLSLLTTDALSAGGKLRLVLEPFARRAPAGVEESVHAFARRRIGREAADVLVDTAVSGISAGDSHALDCAAAFPTLLEMEREHGSLVRAMFARRERPPRLLSFANGMATLTGALATRLGSAVRTRARVRELERSAGGWQVRLEGGGELQADRVVLATSAPGAAAMLARQAPELARTLASFPQAGLAVVAFAFRAEDLARPLDGYGYLVTREARLDTLGVVWESSLFGTRAPAGHVLLRVMLGGARRPELAGLAEAEIVSRAQRELGDVLGIVAPPARTWSWRWPHAITQYTQGHLERVARARAAAARHEGLELCGTSYDGISFTSAIKSAECAAGRVLRASSSGARADAQPDATVALLPPSAHGARAESAGVS